MPTWTCIACSEDDPPGKHLVIDGSDLCISCFKRLFEMALEEESSFPANWGGKPLDVRKYAGLLDADLFEVYQAKEREYICPAPERVYCKRTDPPRRPQECHTFMGQWQNQKVCLRCEKCMWYTCLRCEESFSISDVSSSKIAITHDCDPKRDNELEDRAFRGLKQGKDYQICPNTSCQRRIQLAEGCNHVRCVCKTHFCFVCGKHVRDGTGHWRSDGGCPRYGQPDSARAIYDDADVFDDNESDGDHGGLARMFRRRRFNRAHEDERAIQAQLALIAENERRDANRRLFEREGRAQRVGRRIIDHERREDRRRGK